MKKLLLTLAGILAAAIFTIAPASTVKATDGIVMRQEAQDLLNRAQSELNTAYGYRDAAQSRLNYLYSNGWSQDEINRAQDDLNNANYQINQKQDKVNKAYNVINYVNSRTDADIFLASMQEKFKNQASLAPMQDRINGAKAIASAQLSQINIIQDAIKSQTALAQTNPAIFAQVQELNNQYQIELAQYQAEQQEIAHLQQQYNEFAATMPMPTVDDNIRLSQLRSEFSGCWNEFKTACAE